MDTDNIFVGVDLHKRSFSEVRLTSEGVELSHRRWSSDSEGLSGFAESLDRRHRVVVDVVTGELRSLDREIESIASGDEITGRLRTIDGLGAFSALAIRAVVDRMERFRSAKAFASYTGLVPSYRQSGEVCHTGSITKQGSKILRWVLIQAVPHAMRHNEYLKDLYCRLCFRSSVARARVAVAHALARIIYHVWMEQRPYYRC